MEEFKADLKEMKADIKELVKQGAIHNTLLKTHEARSIELQRRTDSLSARLLPLERHVWIMTIVYSAVGVIATGVLAKFALKLLS